MGYVRLSKSLMGKQRKVSSELKTRREPKIIYFAPDIQESQWTVIQLTQIGKKKNKERKKIRGKKKRYNP